MRNSCLIFSFIFSLFFKIFLESDLRLKNLLGSYETFTT